MGWGAWQPSLMSVIRFNLRRFLIPQSGRWPEAGTGLGCVKTHRSIAAFNKIAVT
jgi:hypothetical protein